MLSFFKSKTDEYPRTLKGQLLSFLSPGFAISLLFACFGISKMNKVMEITERTAPRDSQEIPAMIKDIRAIAESAERTAQSIERISKNSEIPPELLELFQAASKLSERLEQAQLLDNIPKEQHTILAEEGEITPKPRQPF